LKASCQSPPRVNIPFVRAPANVDVFALTNFRGAIRTAVGSGREVFLGGSFTASDNNRVAHVGRWANIQTDRSGIATEQCGNGLDGTVNAMDTYQGTIVMGGTFSLATLHGGSILHTGGLVAWDLESKDWVLVGRTPVPGTVSAIMSTGDRLYVSGRFRSVGGKEVNNVALHSGPLSEVGGWQAVGGGVQGGHVAAMTGLAQEVYIGGSFTQAGTTRVNNIARWDGFTWQALADEQCERQCKHAGGQFRSQDRNCELNGPVTALASTGAVIFAAGVFDSAGGNQVKNLAQYFSGTWKPVLGGVVGSIFDLKVFSLAPQSSLFDSGVKDFECLYVAGDLESVVASDGMVQPLQGIARVCLEPDSKPIGWEAVMGADMGPVLAIHVSHELSVGRLSSPPSMPASDSN